MHHYAIETKTDMEQQFCPLIAATLGVAEWQANRTIELLEEGATIPFISRYRKERTGGLDEVQIESIQTHYEKLPSGTPSASKAS